MAQQDRQWDVSHIHDSRYEAQRMRSVHLSIVVITTVSMLATMPSAIRYQWRENWMIPFIFIGIAACWVMHIRRMLPERARLWVFAVVAWMVVLFQGAHPTSLFDFSMIAAVEFAVYSQTDERPIVHTSLGIYLFLIAYHYWNYRAGGAVPVDELGMRQLMVHVAGACIIYIVALRIIDKREADRATDERIITELTQTRKRTEDFMANVSHELRTPVNVVTGISGVMEERLADAKDREDASHILKAGKRLSDQVDDILDYTEIETGRITITNEPYTIASAMNDVLTSLDLHRRDDLPQIVVDVDANIPRVLLGDARRIKKILGQLIDNAVKFTRRGGVYVNVYQMPEPYGINLCFDVRDTGIGMSREELERIREGIYQADADRNRENSGFGLGLQIVYGLVHAMNGFVRIESTPGEGTRIHISIPQEVREKGRCMDVAHPETRRLAFYQRADKFEVPQVAWYYMKMIGHVIDAFGLTLQRVSSLSDLKDMLNREAFTHVFVADEEYGEDPVFFDALSKDRHVIVVARAGFRPSPGSRVTILRKPLYTLPLVEVLNADNEAEAKAALYDEEEVRFDHLHVMVVDDEELNLVVARGLFGGYGMTVETASGGQEAIDKIKEKDFDVVFMDHMMPVMDGVEAAHRIRDVLQTANRRTSIIALTANAVSGAREMFMREGFDGFVAKPIERKELERTLGAVLRGSRGGGGYR